MQHQLAILNNQELADTLADDLFTHTSAPFFTEQEKVGQWAVYFDDDKGFHGGLKNKRAFVRGWLANAARAARERYAASLLRLFSELTRRSRTPLEIKGYVSRNSPLAIIAFTAGAQDSEYTESPNEEAIKAILAMYPSPISADAEVCIFHETTAYIIKPKGVEYWTREAALEDAKAIVSDMIQEN
ncbi:MAG: hypothetical protein JST84_05320 [Acidobacteria bacterium]|nr:hypothetical protein [Acidobacteriota bacterium]